MLIMLLFVGGCGKKGTVEEVSRIAIPEEVQAAIAQNEADPSGQGELGISQSEGLSELKLIEDEEEPEAVPDNESGTLDEDGTYSSKEDVALYIFTYGKLPSNFITKKEAQELGWVGGSLEDYAPGKCIGGSYFGNYEGKLPEKKGRKYYECDIDTLGAAKRGAKRIIYSNDGLIYYTGDHYETFELLYDKTGDAVFE